MVSLFALLVFRSRLQQPATPLALLSAGVGSGLAYASQQVDSLYHFFPCKVLFGSALISIVLGVSPQQYAKLNQRTIGIVLGISFAFSSLAARHEIRRLHRDSKRIDPVAQIFRHLPPGTSVYMFTPEIGEFKNILQSKLVWSSRYAQLWMLPGIVKDEQAMEAGRPLPKPLTKARLNQLASIQRSTTAEDLGRWKPSVVVVQRCSLAHPCQGLIGQQFDIISWFMCSTEFTSQWSHYRKTKSDTTYDLFTRID